MIVMHKRMLLPLNALLLYLIKYTYWGDNFDSFYDLCEESRVKIDAKTEDIIVDIYSINVALDRIRDGLKCKTWPKCVGISRIRKLDKASVRDYYKEQLNRKSELLMLIRREITAIQQLVQAYI